MTLCSFGCCPSLVRVSGTALMFAAAGGYKNVTELLIKQGANVNERVKATPAYKEQVREREERQGGRVADHLRGSGRAS